MIENGIARLEIAQKIDKGDLIGLRARERAHDEVEIGGCEPRPTIRPDHRELVIQRRRRVWQVILLTAARRYRNRYLCLEQHAGFQPGRLRARSGEVAGRSHSTGLLLNVHKIRVDSDNKR